MDWPTYTPEQEKAFKMCHELIAHCEKYPDQFPKDRMLCGIALDGKVFTEKAYAKGVKDTTKKVIKKLGLEL